MRHIIVNGENAPLHNQSLIDGVVKFTEFNEKCETCGKPLEEAKIVGDNVVCECGKKYPIIDAEKKTVASAKKETAVVKKTTKSGEPGKKETVVKTKPALTKKPDAKKSVARKGSITNTELVATGKVEARDGSCSGLILRNFKTAKVPAKILDKLIAEWKKDHTASDTFKKNPKGYMMWTVLDLIRRGGLKKA